MSKGSSCQNSLKERIKDWGGVSHLCWEQGPSKQGPEAAAGDSKAALHWHSRPHRHLFTPRELQGVLFLLSEEGRRHLVRVGMGKASKLQFALAPLTPISQNVEACDCKGGGQTLDICLLAKQRYS